MSLPAVVQAPRADLPQLGEVVFSQADLAHRVGELAGAVAETYRERELVLVGVLKGAQVFACDLARALPIPVVLDFVSISRYRRGLSPGEVGITQDLSAGLAGRDVLVVEDIVDTGLSLNYLLEEFRRRRPASLSVCSLLDRPELRLAEIPLRFVGFRISGAFLVGYGLDFRDRYRNLPYIAALQTAD